MYTYKTKNGIQDGIVPGIGVITNGTITSETPLENPNLELVTDIEGTQPQAEQPNNMTGTASQANPELTNKGENQ